MNKNNIISFLVDVLESESFTIRSIKRSFKCRLCKVKKNDGILKISEDGIETKLNICESCFRNKYDLTTNKLDITVKRLSEDPKLPHLNL